MQIQLGLSSKVVGYMTTSIKMLLPEQLGEQPYRPAAIHNFCSPQLGQAIQKREWSCCLWSGSPKTHDQPQAHCSLATKKANPEYNSAQNCAIFSGIDCSYFWLLCHIFFGFFFVLFIGHLLRSRIPKESGCNRKRKGQRTNNRIPADSYWLPSHQDSRKLLRPKIETETAGVRNGLRRSLTKDSRGEVESRASKAEVE